MSNADLIEHLEKAESGSRDLDLEIWGNHVAVPRSPRPWKLNVTPPAYTTSIDAIVALIREKLPGWTTDVHTADASPCTYPVHWRVTSLHFDDCHAGIYYQHPKLEERELGEAYGQTPALALCIALLRALDQTEKADG